MVTHIIHIADIHIRTGDPDRARIQEYQHVFDGFLEDVRALVATNKEHEYITVIAGDIFHNKGRIESAGFKLFSRFLRSLSKLTAVFFICGNHDFRQEDPKIPDMLESMLDPWISTNDRVVYMKDTGVYEYKNVGFGVVSVKDTLRKGATTGIKDQLPPYPSVEGFSTGVTERVAVFHGTLGSHGYPLEWFKEYDYLLLGDIHKQQCGAWDGGRLKWGYPGSMIQQDHGETIFGHGYLLWNLKDRVVTAHHVPNKYGLVTMRMRDGEDGQGEIHMGARDWRAVDEVCGIRGFPTNPIVRVYGGSTQQTCDILGVYGVQPRCVHVLSRIDESSAMHEDGTTRSNEKEIDELTQLCSPAKWKEYIMTVAPHLNLDSWLESPDTMNIPKPSADLEIPTKVLDKVNDRIAKFLKYMHEYADALGNTTRSVRNKVVINNVKWDYTLCYGEDNYFDFNHINGHIALLNGKNATGKSSFLDMLCLGLFGEQTRSRIVSGKKMTAKLIHNKKPANKKAMNVRVFFDVNDASYEVIREFGVQADKTNISQFGVELFSIDKSAGEKTLLREGVSAVNAWMEQNVGNLDGVLMSNFITQLDNNNFFTLKQDEQKELMEKALHLEAVTAIANLIHEARLGHTYAIGQVGAVLETTKKLHSTEQVEAPQELELQIKKLEDKLQQLVQDREYALGLMKNQSFSLANVATSVEECDEKIIYLTQKIEQYGDLSVRDNETVYQDLGAKEHMIQSLRTELEQLEHIDIEEYDIEDLQQECMELECRVDDFMKTKPPAPKYSLQAIESVLQDYNAWLGKQPQEFVENEDLDSLEKWVELLYVWKGASEKYERVEFKKKIATFEEYKSVLEEASALQKKIEEFERAGITEIEYKTWTRNYTKWLERFESVRDTPLKTLIKKVKKLREQQEYNKFQELLAELDKELATFNNMPFNEQCWACKQQPWRAHCDEKEKKASSIRHKIAKMKCDKDNVTSVSNEDIEAAEKAVRMREEYDEQLVNWTQEYESWNEWKKEYKLYKKNVATFLELNSQLLDFKERYQHLQEFITELKMWKIQLSRLEASRHEAQNMEKWETEHRNLENKLKDMRALKRKIELTDSLDALLDKHEINQKKLDRYRTWERLCKERDVWQNDKACLLYNKAKEEIERVEVVLKQLRMDYGHSLTAYDKFVTIQKLLAGQSAYLNELKAREKTLDEFEGWFVGNGEEGGYKRWIYVTKVIPILQRELNKCLRCIDTIRMKIEYDKGNFVYTVEDGDRKPSLDKASGYQNFIISLCMRITLGRIGASHHNIRQLIIDEGFTSCDVDNLSKMPVFLEALLKHGDYDSVLLMSHLDGIRESTSLRVDIEQYGAFSRIQLGDPYPVYVTKQLEGAPKTVTRRGRPNTKSRA